MSDANFAGAQDAPLLSIVMPCLDEAATVARCVERALGAIARLGISGEVIVADNGSSDGSRELAAAAGARVVPVAERGYGAALLGGIEAARGRYVIMGDADLSYDFGAIEPFVRELEGGADLVMGNRFRGGIQPGAMPWLHRYVGNPLLSGIGRLFFRSASRDFHCGLRGFRREAVLGLGLQTTGMEFASEMVVKATLLGLRVTEVPTALAPDGRGRPPHLRSFRDGWRHLRFLLVYSPRWLFLYPGAALIAAGVLLGAWVLPGPRVVAGIQFDVHTLMYASAAIFIGYQSLSFALLTKFFAVNERLVPEDPRLSRWLRFATLEVRLAAGVLLVILGFAGTFRALSTWGARNFGELDPTQTLRLVIPSVLALTLGSQVMLSSFFLSVLALGRRRR
jgi:glycosyltransferase involved in cell wall biosynthesis